MDQPVNIPVDNYQIHIFVRAAHAQWLFVVTVYFIEPQLFSCHSTAFSPFLSLLPLFLSVTPASEPESRLTLIP